MFTFQMNGMLNFFLYEYKWTPSLFRALNQQNYIMYYNYSSEQRSAFNKNNFPKNYLTQQNLLLATSHSVHLIYPILLKYKSVQRLLRSSTVVDSPLRRFSFFNWKYLTFGCLFTSHFVRSHFLSSSLVYEQKYTSMAQNNDWESKLCVFCDLIGRTLSHGIHLVVSHCLFHYHSEVHCATL